MRKIYILFMSLAITAAAVSCKKTDNTDPNNNTNQNLQPAKLKLTVQNNNAPYAPVVSPYAKVQLFKTEDDRVNKTNPVTGTLITDDQGVIIIDNLEPIEYFFNITNNAGNMSNAQGGTHFGPLERGKTLGTSILLK